MTWLNVYWLHSSEWGVTLTFYKDVCDDDGFIDDVKVNKVGMTCTICILKWSET